MESLPAAGSEVTFSLHTYTFYGASKGWTAFWVYAIDVRCTDADALTYASDLSLAHRTNVHYMREGLKGVSLYGR